MADAVMTVNNLVHSIKNAHGHEVFRVTVDRPIVFRPGSFAALLGESGCGKTTLLSILGLLRRPDNPLKIGQFALTCVDDGNQAIVHDLADYWHNDRQDKIEELRRAHVGFALQSGDLLPSLTVEENIGLPLRLNGVRGMPYQQRVNELLEAFSLTSDDEEDGANGESKRVPLPQRRVNKISGGQFQRVVLARAIAHRPRIAFVDEPTSALNKTLARTALSHLSESLRRARHPGAIVMITHDDVLANEFADMIIRMAPDGKYAGKVTSIELTSEPVGTR